MKTRLWLLLVVLASLSLPGGLVWAQQAKVTAGLTSDVVEVGEGFYVEVRAEVEGNGNASSPSFDAPPSFSVSGPSTSSTGFSLSFGRGQTQMKRTFTARWYLIGSEQGSFTLKPPTIIVDGKVVTARGKLTVKVVPVGQGPTKPKRPRRRRGAFGGFGSFFGPSPGMPSPYFDDDEIEDPEEQLEPKARELMLGEEPDPWVFLRVLADEEQAVVGEQVTLSYYVYFRTDLRRASQQEPPLTDFLRMDIDQPITDGPLITAVGRYRYHVQLLDKVAVFPLRAGELHVGELEGTFYGRRFGNKEIERTSNDLVISVSEPPLDGRPAGYRVGDVGRFRMAAEVKPRKTKAGDTVAVMVRVSGRGMLPSSLRVPERAGVEWLAPEKKDNITFNSGSVGGWRTFGYAVRLRETGSVDLGTIELPYWDPWRERYEIASAELGRVQVEEATMPGPEATGSAEPSSDDPLAKLPSARPEMTAFEPDVDEGFEPGRLWAMVLAPPLGVAALQLAAGAAATVRRRRRDKKDSPAVLAKRAIADAKGEHGTKDAAAAVERAIHLALEARTGLKTRGILRADLENELTEAGLEPERAAEAIDLLDRCSTLRFEPDPDESAGSDLVEGGRRFIKALRLG